MTTTFRSTGVNQFTPITGTSYSQPLVTSATLAASGAWTASAVVATHCARSLHLFMKYNATSSAGGYPAFQVVGSSDNMGTNSGSIVAPVVGDDAWYPAAVTDGVVTAGVMTGTLVTGEDFTLTPDFGIVTHRALLNYLEPADNSTDKIRICVSFNVEPFRWFYLRYAEKGLTANPGTLAVRFGLSG